MGAARGTPPSKGVVRKDQLVLWIGLVDQELNRNSKNA